MTRRAIALVAIDANLKLVSRERSERTKEKIGSAKFQTCLQDGPRKLSNVGQTRSKKVEIEEPRRDPLPPLNQPGWSRLLRLLRTALISQCSLRSCLFLGADFRSDGGTAKVTAGKPKELGDLRSHPRPRHTLGHVGEARELTKRAVDSAIRADRRGNAAIWQANAALQRAFYGNPADTRPWQGQRL